MKNKNLKGYIITLSAYLIWGILPIYWKLLQKVSYLEILVHRILWTMIFLMIISTIKYRKYIIDNLKNNSKLKYIFISAGLLGINWSLFIYAVNTNRILDASLGYYINPLISVLLGVVFLKERLPREQIISVILALFGVIYLTFNYGRLPIISLVLAFSFGSYGLVRKKINLKSIPAVLLESIILFPIFLILFLISINSFSDITFFNSDTSMMILLILAGIMTLVPLVLFGQGVTMIPLKSIGFLQYIAPTIMLLIGTIIYNEPFTISHFISFGFIWLALGIYTWSIFRKSISLEKF